MRASRRQPSYLPWAPRLRVLLAVGSSVAIGAILTPWLLHAIGPPAGLVFGLVLVALFTCLFLRLFLGRLDALSPKPPVATLLDTTTRELPRIRQRRRLLRIGEHDAQDAQERSEFVAGQCLGGDEQKLLKRNDASGAVH